MTQPNPPAQAPTEHNATLRIFSDLGRGLPPLPSPHSGQAGDISEPSTTSSTPTPTAGAVADFANFMAGAPAAATTGGGVQLDTPPTNVSAKPGDAYLGINDAHQRFIHSGWWNDRRRIFDALSHLTPLPDKRRRRFADCGSGCRILRNDKIKGVYRVQAFRCNDRFCLPCSKLRASRIRDQLTLLLATHQRCSLITLTLKAENQPLQAIIARATTHFRALRALPWWKAAVTGGAAILETKVGRDGRRWHVHWHIVAACNFLPKHRLSAAWLAITGDSKIVDVRRVTTPETAVRYITKYVTKSADSSVVRSPAHLAEALIAFRGSRLVTTFGTWRGTKLTERLDDETLPLFCPADWSPWGTWDDLRTLVLAGQAEALAIATHLNLLARLRARPAPT